MGMPHEEGRHMSNARWTWKAAVAAAAVVAATALLAPRTARSDGDDESEELVLTDDVVALQDAIDNWDDDGQREDGLATFLEAESRDALFAPVEDPAAMDSN